MSLYGHPGRQPARGPFRFLSQPRLCRDGIASLSQGRKNKASLPLHRDVETAGRCLDYLWSAPVERGGDGALDFLLACAKPKRAALCFATPQLVSASASESGCENIRASFRITVPNEPRDATSLSHLSRKRING